MKIGNLCTYLLIITFITSSCYGPRNIYSSGPFISPFPLNKGESSVEVTHSYNSRKSNPNDSAKNNKDNGYGFYLTHSFTNNNQFTFYTDFKKEKNCLLDTSHYFLNNAGFDFSSILSKRITSGIGFTHFFKSSKTTSERASKAITGLLSYQHSSLSDSGLINQTNYKRNFKSSNLFFILQFSSLFNISKQFRIAYIERFTLSHYFSNGTNYSNDELKSTGLDKQGKTQLYFCLIGLDIELQPFKKIPVYITSQWYNDWVMWNHFMSTQQPLGGTYIKGTGVEIGLRYQVHK